MAAGRGGCSFQPVASFLFVVRYWLFGKNMNDEKIYPNNISGFPEQIDEQAENILLLNPGLRTLIQQSTAPLHAEIAELKQHIEELEALLNESYDSLQLEIASDRRRLTALEKPVCGERMRKHADDLHDMMIKNNMRQVTFRQAAQMLGITYRHMQRLHAILDEDPRFDIIKDARHKTRRLIKLTVSTNQVRQNATCRMSHL